MPGNARFCSFHFLALLNHSDNAFFLARPGLAFGSDIPPSTILFKS
jgi:hypothetical protein